MKCTHVAYESDGLFFYLADSGSNEGRTSEEQVPMESRIFLLCFIINIKEATSMA